MKLIEGKVEQKKTKSFFLETFVKMFERFYLGVLWHFRMKITNVQKANNLQGVKWQREREGGKEKKQKKNKKK